jgi:hypothetical protein
LENALEPFIVRQALIQRAFRAGKLLKPHVGIGANGFGKMRHRAIVDVMLPPHYINDIPTSTSHQEAAGQDRIRVPRAAFT